MARESLAAKSKRLKRIMARLRRAYPQARCALHHQDPLQLLIATILSAQCTDQRVNQVTAKLFQRYRTAADYAAADRAELEALIRPTGFFRNKARSIQAACRALVERHGGQVPRTMAELTALDGVGRKTANVVLGNAFGINEGIPVDTHVARLARRLGLSRHTQPERIERDLMTLVPRRHWAMLSHWLIWHGRRRCSARKPDCSNCEIRGLCPSNAAASTQTPP
jgi:endonuclease-3